MPDRYVSSARSWASVRHRLRSSPLASITCFGNGRWRDGTTHIVMSPLQFMQRLAARVPRPRLHLIRFHGVLAPHAKLRAAMVPCPHPADNRARSRSRSRACSSARAHELRAAAQARIRDRHRTVPALWRALEDYRRHRRSSGDCPDPHAPGLARARTAPIAGVATRSVPSGLT